MARELTFEHFYLYSTRQGETWPAYPRTGPEWQPNIQSPANYCAHYLARVSFSRGQSCYSNGGTQVQKETYSHEKRPTKETLNLCRVSVSRGQSCYSNGRTQVQKEIYIHEKSPTNTTCIHEKRPTNETFILLKRGVQMVLLFEWSRSGTNHIFKNRPACMKRDLCTWKETYSQEKRPTKETLNLCRLSVSRGQSCYSECVAQVSTMCSNAQSPDFAWQHAAEVTCRLSPCCE